MRPMLRLRSKVSCNSAVDRGSWRALGLSLSCALGVVLLASGVAAQPGPRHPQDAIRLPCAAQPNAKTVDLSTRRDYRSCQYAGNLSEPEASARAFLQHFAWPLGMDTTLSDLMVADVRQTSVSAMTRFAQQHEGIPIFDTWVQVNQGSDGSI